MYRVTTISTAEREPPGCPDLASARLSSMWARILRAVLLRASRLTSFWLIRSSYGNLDDFVSQGTAVGNVGTQFSKFNDSRSKLLSTDGCGDVAQERCSAGRGA